ncbi:hypothetical protein F4801DRAFT_553130 [Xylaria longipes]|nr:hypothetical protein F4801DRAFT_553130 [Xylaria longipes]
MVNLSTIEEAEAAWSDYEEVAFIHLENPERYSLRPNREAVPGTKNVYMMSAHHQLHCLKRLHIAFVGLKNLSPQKLTEDLVSIRHAEHCFNYLRQGILCAGDVTLEGLDPEGTLLGYGFNTSVANEMAKGAWTRIEWNMEFT